jgi:hypothetical protein
MFKSIFKRKFKRTSLVTAPSVPRTKQYYND